MPMFRYTGRAPGGETVSGEVEAKNRADALVALDSRSIRIESIGRESFRKWRPAVRKPGLTALSRFTRQFCAMNGAGLPVVESLETLTKEIQSPALMRAVEGVAAEIRGGKSLAGAMALYPGVFTDMFVHLVRAGETAGALDTVLERLAAYFEKMDALRRKIIAALIYPAVLVVVCIIATAVLLIWVVPILASMFVEGEQELPAATSVVLFFSTAFRRHGLHIAALVAAAAALFRSYLGTRAGRRLIDGIALKTPVLGAVVRKALIGRFCQTLATMLSSGVDLLDALKICSAAAGNSFVSREIDEARAGIENGLYFSDRITRSAVFPPMVAHMIAAGEKTGELARMLDKIAQIYETEVDIAVGGLTSVLEPLMLLLMGGIIGTILVAMYLPMFDVLAAGG